MDLRPSSEKSSRNEIDSRLKDNGNNNLHMSSKVVSDDSSNLRNGGRDNTVAAESAVATKESTTSKPSLNSPVPSDQEAKFSEKKKRKKTDITIDMGSRGKVKVKLGKIKNKPWKSPLSGAKSDGKESHLLGNKTISGWDEDDDVDEQSLGKKQKAAAAKAKKMRDTIFQESRQMTKDRKRKMYLSSWDAGLDAGKVSFYIPFLKFCWLGKTSYMQLIICLAHFHYQTKKVRDKEPNWYDEKLPEEKNPFHRIQESLSQMNRGRKGFQNTSMKKRRKVQK